MGFGESAGRIGFALLALASAFFAWGSFLYDFSSWTIGGFVLMAIGFAWIALNVRRPGPRWRGIVEGAILCLIGQVPFFMEVVRDVNWYLFTLLLYVGSQVALLVEGFRGAGGASAGSHSWRLAGIGFTLTGLLWVTLDWVNGVPAWQPGNVLVLFAGCALAAARSRAP